jgi:hypothetical protein
METRPKVLDGPGSPEQATDLAGHPVWVVTLAIRRKVRQPVELVDVEIGQPHDPADVLLPGDRVEVLPAILRKVA